MRNPRPLTTHLLNLGAVSDDMVEDLTTRQMAVTGVAEAVVIAEDGIAYLKVDRRHLDRVCQRATDPGSGHDCSVAPGRARGDCRPQRRGVSVAQLPEQFRGLEPLLDAWAIETEDARWRKRISSEMSEIRELYDAINPRLDEIVH